MDRNEKENTTRNRIIEAAGQLFAEKGFKETTVREICESANANLAAVNYHFRDKENLYKEIFRFIFSEIIRNYPITKDLGEGGSSEERLHAFIYTLLRRMHDPDKPEWQAVLFHNERMNSKFQILSIFKKQLMKERRILASIIADLLGQGADDESVKLCEQSVVGQIIFQLIIREKNGPPHFHDEPMTAETIEIVAKHITEFSLAGIGRIRELSKKGKGKK